jgi:hypothetical protein
MVDFLDEKRKEIDARLQELRPLVDEFNRLEKAASALAGVGTSGPSSGGGGGSGSGGGSGTATRRRRGPGRPRATASSSGNGGGSGGARRGRPRGSGTRGKQALELVKAKPGITIAELADAMNIKANYLYRVMPSLEAEGQVVKRDGGWHPA